mgnify:FL=1
MNNLFSLLYFLFSYLSVECLNQEKRPYFNLFKSNSRRLALLCSIFNLNPSEEIWNLAFVFLEFGICFFGIWNLFFWNLEFVFWDF